MVSRAQRSTSFGNIAPEYDRLRPPPAPEAVDWLVPDRRATLVDVGAGTGLLTRALASRAEHVIAVEPDERMREVLHLRSPAVEVVEGRGEAIPLPDASADGVFASSAWHWMDPEQAAPEIARVLRDDGRFGLIWTTRQRDIPWLRSDLWFREARERPAAEEDHARRDGSGHRRVEFPAGSPFTNIETRTFHYSRPMTPADIVDMLTTYSVVITADAESVALGRARAAAALADQFPDSTTIDVPIASHCWRADRLPRQR
jgi:SAM-dependent methyltransferase